MRAVQLGNVVGNLARVAIVLVLSACTLPAASAAAQDTLEEAITQAQADKAKELAPYTDSRGEQVANKVEDILINGLRWRPYLDSAYSGGGFPFGVGYRRYVSSYNQLDLRGSYTFTGYTRAEAEFTAPHLFDRHAQLSVIGGWRKATEVGFFGIGPDTSKSQRTNYQFEQPYASVTLSFMPTRKHWTFAAGEEVTRWSQQSGSGSSPSVETVYTPATLPGLGAETTYLHSTGSAALDWRPSPGYARRGGYFGVTVHDYTDTRSALGFDEVDYEAIQHFPILREAWVISLRAEVQTAFDKSGQQIPFYMLPSLGGTSSLRGYEPWRFRDRNSLLLQGEWRIMVNRFLDTAFFYDAGKVGPHASDLDLQKLHHDAGFGFRFHSVDATVLRVDVAKSDEGTRLVFAAVHAF
jgi:outer membrane protein assembly factor BamA